MGKGYGDLAPTPTSAGVEALHASGELGRRRPKVFSVHGRMVLLASQFPPPPCAHMQARCLSPSFSQVNE